MPKHEEKQCEGCDKRFECKIGNILECECFRVELSSEVKAIVDEQYTDCICPSCLRSIALEHREKEEG